MDKLLGIKAHLQKEPDKDTNVNSVYSQYLPWVEKYRPQKLDDIAYQSEIINSLKQSIKLGKMQHLLFYGPPGTGKTSTILAAAKEMFGISDYKFRILELNASDERGIDVIREKVKNFAQKKISRVQTSTSCPTIPDLQIVILDEADLMTIEAQSALRRIIEDYSKNTRFCIICNYLSKIIDPIASRCAKYLFNPLSKDAQISKIDFILSQEKISLSRDSVELIIDICDGDLRRAINQIQALCSLFENSNIDIYGDVKKLNLKENIEISQNEIGELCGIIPYNKIYELFSNITSKAKCESLYQFTGDILCEGFDILQLIKQVNDFLGLIDNIEHVNKFTFKNKTIRELVAVLAEAELNSIEGTSNDKELINLFINMRKVLEKNNNIE